ncbi:hypothetical protein HER21_50465, partial [Pseudomonas sp. BGM005]|nr:hypothetical protein [Pseudomonas sp. BG5]
MGKVDPILVVDGVQRRFGGLTAVEFWRWTDKDLDAVEAALDETDLEVTSLVAEPMIALTD